MLPLFGGLVFVAFAMIAIAVELALLGGFYRNTAAAADAAAEAGAAMISAGSLYTEDALLVDRAAASASAAAVASGLSSPTASAAIDITSLRVCVTIDDMYQTRTLSFIGVSAIRVRVDSCAEPRTG
jgi:hypothetical protein